MPPLYTEADFDFVDAGIRREVMILTENGVSTFESCEGGPGHAFPEPTIRFSGSRTEGLRALSIALAHRLYPVNLRRYYRVEDGEAVGPAWEITFCKPELPNWRNAGKA